MDWIYVSDVVGGLVSVLTTTGIDGTSVDIGSGLLVSVRDVIEMLAQSLSVSTVVQYANAEPEIAEEVRRADADRTHWQTGWRPAISLKEGLARTAAALQGGTTIHRPNLIHSPSRHSLE